MKKILSFMAYLWAGISFFLLLSVFMNMEGYQRMMMQLPFMKVDPLYTGGDIRHEIQKSDYTLRIHEPVFSALVGESDEGYVQVDILSEPTMTIHDTLDYNADGRPDFCLRLCDGQFEAAALDGRQYGVWQSCRTDSLWMVRVWMENPRE